VRRAILQSLDVSAVNRSHQAIASLLATKKAAALITTNFDRLVERSIEKLGGRYRSYVDEQDFKKLPLKKIGRKSSALIIKIHGCVSWHGKSAPRFADQTSFFEAEIAGPRICKKDP
jgi:NAD-dependent SIR2 family protein deacetylase